MMARAVWATTYREGENEPVREATMLLSREPRLWVKVPLLQPTAAAVTRGAIARTPDRGVNPLLPAIKIPRLHG